MKFFFNPMTLELKTIKKSFVSRKGFLMSRKESVIQSIETDFQLL